VTGARTTLPQNVRGFLASIRKLTRKPLAVGFGISTPEQVHAVRAHVDGVIVGSALIDHLEKSVPHAARFVASLQKVLNPNPSPSSPRRKPARHTTGAPGRQLCGDLGSSGVGTGFRPSPE
jgi:hypothetical protein